MLFTVRITINNGWKEVEAAPGRSLLLQLADHGVFISSACGGAGTCGTCTCNVRSGAGPIGETEAGFISDEQAQDGLRLACQVKLTGDADIEIPPEAVSARRHVGVVRSNRHVAAFIKETVIDLEPGVNLNHRAGGYVQVEVPPYEIAFRDFMVEEPHRAEWAKHGLWTLEARNETPTFRAYSMANHPAEGNRVTLNVRIATPPAGTGFAPGKASSYLFSLRPGDRVSMTGPFGSFYIKDTDREMVYIGGGAGMAPLRSHLFDLLLTRRTTRKVSYWYGARSRRDMFYEEDFRALEQSFPNFSFHPALSEPLPDDAWTGPIGLIHQIVLDHYLKRHPQPAAIEYYLSGPPLMVGAAQLMLKRLGVKREMIAFDQF
jgi:Na+-transporting NADH:ubiquinone oxidoreductase subunit F